MIYLSATLPPELMDRFYRVAMIDKTDCCQEFRCKTSRGNISYQLHALHSDEQQDQEEELSEFIDRLISQLDTDGGKMIIFVNTQAGAEDIASRYNIMAHHSVLGDKKGKSSLKCTDWLACRISLSLSDLSSEF